MIYCFDIDQTLFRTRGTDYASAKPIQERIAIVQRLHREGHTIKLFTARGSESGIDWRELTLSQLENFGVPFVELSFGKPAADVYVDDKGVNDKDFFGMNLGLES